MIKPPHRLLCGGFCLTERLCRDIIKIMKLLFGNEAMKRLVIGMTAHVDAGKTTLSEAMLFVSGELRKAGRVDKRDSFLDTHAIERSRGITVFAKQAVMHLNGAEYTLLDTPGHTDFSAETERALSVLDCAILVISGIDGVQSHTETIWRLLARYNIPVFVFVNKTDIAVTGKDFLLAELQAKLSHRVVDFTPREDKTPLYEELAELDENMMNGFLETGMIPDEDIREAVFKRNVFPCYFGSALKFTGITQLLDGISAYAKFPEYGDKFGARVYKITTEGSTRLTHMKITGGSLKVRSEINGEKVTALRIYSGAKFTSVDTAGAGCIVAAAGLSETFAGQGIGFEKESTQPLLAPVLTYRLVLPQDVDVHTMYKNMFILEEEDPALHVSFDPRFGDIHVSLMGKIQLEVLTTVIKDRFGIDVSFDRGSIAYKETIASPVVGIGHYEPLRHYAEVHLLMEPLPAGSGVEICSDCSEDVLDRNWQRLILSNLHDKTHIGVLTGSPITDIKITLVTGRASLKHTEGGDFRQASYRAVRMGLRYAQSVLLEPFYSFTLRIPAECTGRALNDLQQMGGEFSSPENDGEFTVITGKAPVSEMADYHTDVSGYSKGRGRLTCVFEGYYPCHNAEEVIENIGYDVDGDLDNTADSVFCAHGAGYGVKWDEVRDYAHLENGISFASDSRADDEPVRRSVSVSPADDDELMAIFERTYGKINRDPRTKMRREYEPPKTKAKPLPQGPIYLLVDGYNIIFSWDELKKLAADDLDLARSRLIQLMCNYRGYKKCEVILVFDAYKIKGDHREVEQVGGISVIYTKEAETADMYIEKVSHELAKEHRVRVATSDGAEQVIILGNGAYRVSAAEFYEEVKAVETEIRDIIDRNSQKGRNTRNIKVKE